jgi:hypothetical protein
MNSSNRGERGMGGGLGQGGGRGRMGGLQAGGQAGTCRCPNCGHTQPHERGVPCTQVPCPKYKTAMIRE